MLPSYVIAHLFHLFLPGMSKIHFLVKKAKGTKFHSNIDMVPVALRHYVGMFDDWEDHISCTPFLEEGDVMIRDRAVFHRTQDAKVSRVMYTIDVANSVSLW